MPLDKKYDSMIAYYQASGFNPVPISVEDPSVWQAHKEKRNNLYTRHLGIPLSLLRDRSVLEFGCNSGENALVLADAGARLTLVEPNTQVHPRLRTLFDRFGLVDQIADLSDRSISDYECEGRFDLVVAEGFLFCLPDRSQLVERMARFLKPEGFLVFSWNDRFGMLVEQVKRLFLWRGLALLNEDPQGETSLKIAQILFGEDFARLNASRSLPTWWKDMLVQPFIIDEWHWSYDELIPLIEKCGLELHATSPRWPLLDQFGWYKNTRAPKERHREAEAEWRKSFLFFLTGRSFDHLPRCEASDEVIDAAASLVARLSRYGSEEGTPEDLTAINWPEPLDQFLRSFGDDFIDAFTNDMARLLTLVRTDDFDHLTQGYADAATFRQLWGTPYHYLACRRLV